MKNRLAFFLYLPLLLGSLLGSVTLSAQTAYVANFNSNNVSVINTVTDLVVATIAVGTNPVGVAASLDGTRVYVGNSGSNNVSVINTATNSVVTTIPVGKTPQGVAVSPDGNRVYTANYASSSVSVINTITDSVVANIPVTGPSGIIVSPDGTKVYVGNFTSAKITVINASDNSVETSLTTGTFPLDLTVSPDGTRVYVANGGSHTVSVINAATNSLITNILVGADPTAIGISPGGDKVYVSNYSSHTVSVINTAINAVASTIPVGSVPRGIDVTPDGTKLYVANRTYNNVRVINTANNSLITTVAVGSRPDHQGRFISTYPVYFPGPQDLCIDADVQTSLGGGIPAGGVYSGPGVTDDGNGMTYTFDPASAGVGKHLIGYTHSGIIAQAGVEVFESPVVTLTLPDTLFMTQSMPLTGIGGGSPAGGVYSDSFGEINDDGNGETFSFNGFVSISDSNLITYTYADLNGCTNSVSKIIFVAAPISGVSNLADLHIKAFPNPTTGIVELRGWQPQAVRVIDQLGRVVLIQENPQPRIDLSRMPAGVYTLLVHVGEGRWVSGKIVKR